MPMTTFWKTVAAGCLAAAGLIAGDSGDSLESTLVAGGGAAATVAARPLRRAEPAREIKLWRYSVAAVGAANILDIHSSWGKHELNNALASSGGTFGLRGVGVKSGLQGGLMGLEYLLTRGHGSPRLYRALTYVNFAAGGVIAATAVRNYGIGRIGR